MAKKRKSPLQEDFLSEQPTQKKSSPVGPFTINFSPSFSFFCGEQNNKFSPEGPPFTINFSPSFCFFGGEQQQQQQQQQHTQNKPPSSSESPFTVNSSPFGGFPQPKQTISFPFTANSSPFGTFQEPKQTTSPFGTFPEPKPTISIPEPKQTNSLPFTVNSTPFGTFPEPKQTTNSLPFTVNSSPFFGPSTTFGFSQGKQTNSPFTVNNSSPSTFGWFGAQRQNKFSPSSLFPNSPEQSQQNNPFFSGFQNNKPEQEGFHSHSPFHPRQEVAAQYKSEFEEIDARTKRLEPLLSLGLSIAKQTDFALSLAYHVISTTEAKDTNFVFSPISMHVVLSMVAAGSGGPTRAQFLDYLKSSSSSDLNSLSSRIESLLFADGAPLGGPHLSFANGVWVDKNLTLKPAFKETVDKNYKAASNQADFLNKANEVREEVNSWAEKKTNGLIKDLLPPGSVDDLTRLILANALYFKGVWAEKFDASQTKDNDFFILNGTNCVRVPFMSSRKDQFIHAFDGFKVLRLPYEQGRDKSRRFSMLIYLPDARYGLPALLDKFGSDPRFIQKHLPGSVRVREFRVPKFKIGFGFEAKEVLKEHGLVLPFYRGGLTEMVEKGGERLCITSFHHKTCIEVDEEGTEAAAASACVIGVQMCVGPKPELDFVADHPFLFVVREDVSGGVLFVGQLLNPAAAA